MWQFLLVLVSNALPGVFLFFGKQQECVVEQYIIEWLNFTSAVNSGLGSVVNKIYDTKHVHWCLGHQPLVNDC